MTLTTRPPDALGTAPVLVIDDDAAMVQTVCEILESAGIHAAGVGTARVAGEWCEANWPDLVLVDQRLPDGWGTDLAARLKEAQPNLSVLLLTGYVSAESAIAAVGIVDEYLTKPVPPLDLIKSVRAGIERSRLRRENQELLKRLREANEQLEATVEERTRELLEARDRAMAASRFKSDFLATMSHEIRTPMNGVIGVADLLELSELTEEQREYVSILRRSGQALLGIINNVLDLSKIEAGKLELEAIDLSVAELVEDVATLLGAQAFGKGVELVVSLDPAFPAVVTGDPGRLRQVLTNLVGNAVKFTDEGEVVVRVDVDTTTANDVRAIFTVSDTGIGISPEELPRLFSTFTQLGSAERFGGTGLGLAISQQLVTLMGGRIDCESERHKGTTFGFALTFPVPSGSATPVAGDGWPSLGGRRVVVAAPSAALRVALVRVMAAFGAHVVEVTEVAGLRAWLEGAVVTDDPGLLAFVDQRFLDAVGFIHEGTPGVLLCALVPPYSAGTSGDTPTLAIPKPVRLAALRAALGLVATPSGAAGVATGAQQAGRVRQAGRVLVTEDNPVNQFIAVRLLDRLGYDADIAANGREAVSAVASGRYAIVLMDCQMPEMDGFEATIAIRGGEGPHRRTPIIAMTAGAMSGEEERCLAVGMDAYLSKPVNWPDLERVLERFVSPDAETRSDDGTERTEMSAAPGVDTASPALDPTVLAAILELGDGSGSAAADLYALFLRDAEPRVAGLRRAATTGAIADLRRIGHALRGSSANLGALGVAALCAEIERLVATGVTDQLPDVLDRLDVEFDRVRQTVQDDVLGNAGR